MPQIRKITEETIIKKEKTKRNRSKPKVPKIATLAQLRKRSLTTGVYKFTSKDCDCVHYSDVYGAAMYCIHKHPLMARDNSK